MKASEAIQQMGMGVVALQRRYGRYLWSGFACVWVAAFGAVVLVPFASRNKHLNIGISQKRSLLASTRRLIEKQQDIEKEYHVVFSPDTPQLQQDPSVWVLKALEEVAVASGVKIMNIRQTRVVPQKEFRQIEVSLTAQGDKESYTRFLYALSDAVSLFSVKEFKLKADAKERMLEGRLLIAYNQVSGL